MKKIKLSIYLIIACVLNINVLNVYAKVSTEQNLVQYKTTSLIENSNSYTVTLPKSIKLDPYTKSSDYLVNVKGNIADGENIVVTPDPTFTMKSLGKNNVTAYVAQNKTTFNYEEMIKNKENGISTIGSILANGLSAGKWTGTFNFDIIYNEKLEELTLTRENIVNYIIPETGNSIVTTGDVIIPSIVKDKTSEKKYQITGIEGNLSSKKSIFSNPLNVKSVTLPNTIKRIGEAAFCNCKNLTNINNIPCDITDIDGSAFYGTQWLKNKQNENKDDNSLVYFNNMLVDGSAASGEVKLKDGIDKICPHAFYENKNESHVIIPESITCVDNHAFDKYNGLKSVTLPESIKRIEDYAFFSCGNLTSVIIPNNTTYIGNNAFNNCRGLKEITISDNVMTIGSYAFNNCGGLGSINIPSGVTQISIGMFYNCGSLRSITMHNNITAIGDYAFNNCRSLTSISIPNNIRSINTAVFTGCTKISAITYKEQTYTNKSALFIALTDNNVTFENDIFDDTALSN